MTRKAILLLAGIVVFVLLIGFLLGRLQYNFPILQLNPEIKISEALTICVTLFIGIYVPLLVKKWIEDSKTVKAYLVDEIKGIIVSCSKINEKLKTHFHSGVIQQTDKDSINYLFHLVELDLASFREQFLIAYPTQAGSINAKLIEEYNSYKDYLTDGPFMISTYIKIDESFYRQNNQNFSRFTSGLKMSIQTIYKL